VAKEHGLGANFYLDGWDLSSDTGSLSKISKSVGLLLQTGIDKYAIERKSGVLDGEISWMTFFNPTNAHLKLEDLPRTDVVATYFHKTTLGAPVACMVGKQVNYDPKRGNDGSLTGEVQTLANAYWLDWGLATTAGKRTDTAATDGTGVDFGAAGTYGLQAYLQAFALTGTDVTVKLQQSSDNGVADGWADVTGGGFTAVTAPPLGQRIQTARNLAVERYLRVVTTGTFTSAVFAVGVTVNRTEYTI